MLGGREITLAQQYAVVGVVSIPLFLLAGAGKKKNAFQTAKSISLTLPFERFCCVLGAWSFFFLYRASRISLRLHCA